MQVTTKYLPERSSPRDQEYWFAYFIRISNVGPDTAATVTNRWKEYFPAGNVAMGDSERGHLD